jgi:hypothetical protein
MNDREMISGMLLPLLSGDRIMRAGDADPRLSLRRRRREIALRILY